MASLVFFCIHYILCTTYVLQVWLEEFRLGVVYTSYWWLKPQVCKPWGVIFSSKLCVLHIFLILVLADFLYYFWILDSGSMEFVVPPADSSVFFPISVQFLATNTFSDLKVCSCFLFDIITGYVSEVLSVSFAFCFTCFAPVNCNKHMCFIAIHI